MFAKFKYEPLQLGDILLDDRNPRIVSMTPLTSQEAILDYLFKHEDLSNFIKKISHNGKNRGAERPYVIKKGTKYVVVEGNTRIAAYKVLAGLMKPPSEYVGQIPHVSDDFKGGLLVVDCTIAPNREAMLPIMAESHFGEGDKSKWGYLGSRMAIFKELQDGKTISQIAKSFGQTPSQVTDYVMEYRLYAEALALNWTAAERDILLDPNVTFNPPVRFLQSQGHKESVGVSYDRPNLCVIFDGKEAKSKFKHLLTKLVVNPQKGLSGPSSFHDVFKDYVSSEKPSAPPPDEPGTPSPPPVPTPPTPPPSAGGPKLNTGALYNYPVTAHSNLLKQLMKEASRINAKNLPCAATFLLRNLLEAMLKHIIDQCNANPNKSKLSLEDAIGICKGKNVPLDLSDKAILKDFETHHLAYINLGAHGNTIPHADRVFQIRDLLDQFVKKNI